MTKHRIAILSDTHDLLRPEVKEILGSCEVILHAGDIMSKSVMEEIGSIAPTYFVRGNADKEWAEDLPTELKIELFGIRFYMVHNKKFISISDNEADVILYGHTHQYEEKRVGNTLYFNPGSCGPRRVHQEITMAVMTVEEGTKTFTIERIDIAQAPVKQEQKPKDITTVIRGIIKDMRANRKVGDIAKRNHVTEEFVRQVLQIYTTHPGIDMDGILNRLPE